MTSSEDTLFMSRNPFMGVELNLLVKYNIHNIFSYSIYDGSTIL